MGADFRTCRWCGKTYDFYKSQASSRLELCGKKCEREEKDDREKNSPINKFVKELKAESEERRAAKRGGGSRATSSGSQRASDESLIAFAESQKAQAEAQKLAIGAQAIKDERTAELNKEKRTQRRETISKVHIPGIFKDLYVDRPLVFFLMMIGFNFWLIVPLALMHFSHKEGSEPPPIPDTADGLKSDFLKTKQDYEGLMLLTGFFKATELMARMKSILDAYRLNHREHEGFEDLEAYFVTAIKELSEGKGQMFQKVVMGYGAVGLITLYITLDKFGIF